MLVLRIGLTVWYVGNRALEDRPAGPQGPAGARRVYAMQLLKGFGGEVVLGDLMDHLAIELKERAEETVAEPHGTSDDRVEDRLDVGLRAADDAQDLRRRCLLLQSLGQVAVASLQLLEEAHILDSDHGLVCEGLEELGLCIAERDCLLANDVDCADRGVATQHRDRKDAAIADRLCTLGAVRVFSVALSIGDRNHTTLENRLGSDAHAVRRCRVCCPNRLEALERRAVITG